MQTVNEPNVTGATPREGALLKQDVVNTKDHVLFI